MSIIKLTNGGSTKVSVGDFKELSRFTWYLSKGDDGYDYVRRTDNMELLSRFIMKPKKGLLVDHINHNTLDNQRENLRVCTFAENARNSLYSTNTSGYRGVIWHKGSSKWNARISVNYKKVNLGYFKSIKDAAKAYNEAAMKYHGEFATLNLIEE